jgi:hypothetical protein
LQRHQILHGIEARIEAGGDEAGEETRNGGTVLVLVQERVGALPDEQLQAPPGQIVVERRAGYR